MAELLDDQAIDDALGRVQDWHRDGDSIVRDFEFADFAKAMAFVNTVAEAAEDLNHHPDILVHGWNKVRLTVSNHSAGGLTEPDFQLAGMVDGLAGG
jgi:4a-hydroxytetrahydrobiopterin dehydratase